jgi:hypothetical protein
MRGEFSRCFAFLVRLRGNFICYGESQLFWKPCFAFLVGLRGELSLWGGHFAFLVGKEGRTQLVSIPEASLRFFKVELRGDLNCHG